MHLQILQESLNKALLVASRFSSGRVQLPILANIYLKAKGNKLFIASTNLETSFSTHLGAKVEKEGEITIPSHTLTDIISNLNPGPVDISVDKEEVKIKSGGFTSSLSGMNANDFPNVPTSIDKNSIEFEKEEFVEILSKMLFPISFDETRPILTGMLIEFKKDIVNFVSTDGFRLSKKTIKNNIDKNYVGKSIVIPKNILLEVYKLSGTGDKIIFSYKEKESQIVFGYDDSFYSSRILNGNFPDYQKVIPKNSKIKVNIGRTDLLQAIKLASVFARDSSNMIRLCLQTNSLDVQSESQLSGSQKNKIEIKTDGEIEKSLTIGFNYKFIEEVLSVIKSEDVTIEFNDENSPGLFRDIKDPNFLHIVMPLKI